MALAHRLPAPDPAHERAMQRMRVMLHSASILVIRTTLDRLAAGTLTRAEAETRLVDLLEDI